MTTTTTPTAAELADQLAGIRADRDQAQAALDEALSARKRTAGLLALSRAGDDELAERDAEVATLRDRLDALDAAISVLETEYAEAEAEEDAQHVAALRADDAQADKARAVAEKRAGKALADLQAAIGAMAEPIAAKAVIAAELASRDPATAAALETVREREEREAREAHRNRQGNLHAWQHAQIGSYVIGRAKAESREYIDKDIDLEGERVADAGDGVGAATRKVRTVALRKMREADETLRERLAAIAHDHAQRMADAGLGVPPSEDGTQALADEYADVLTRLLPADVRRVLRDGLERHVPTSVNSDGFSSVRTVSDPLFHAYESEQLRDFREALGKLAAA